MAKVIVEYGERQRIAAMFKTSLPTVRAALYGETNTPLAKKIRAAAIKRGGVVKQPIDRQRHICAMQSHSASNVKVATVYQLKELL